jgi:hypothetical protein
MTIAAEKISAMLVSDEQDEIRSRTLAGWHHWWST